MSNSEETDWARLRQFVRERSAAPRLAEEALDRLEPVYGASRGAESFRLAIDIEPFPHLLTDQEGAKRRVDALRAQSKETLERLLARPVTRIEFVSARMPQPKLDRLATEVNGRMSWDYGDESYPPACYQAAHALALTTCSLGEQLRQAGIYLKDRLDEGMRIAFIERLDACLAGRTKGLPPRCDSRALAAATRDAFRTSTFYGLAYAMLGDRDMVERILPTIELLPKAVPIAEMHDRGHGRQSGEWIVLVD